MILLKCIVLLNVSLIVAGVKTMGLKENDRCILENGGFGECKFYGSCRYVEILLNDKKQPDMCRYIQTSDGLHSTPLYCCPDNDDDNFRIGELKDFFSNTFNGLIPGPNVQCNYKGDLPFHCCNNKVMDVKEPCEDDECPPLPKYDVQRFDNLSDLIISKCLKYQQYIRKCLPKKNSRAIPVEMERVDLCNVPVSSVTEERIVRGDDTVDGEFPHLALLGHRVTTAKNNVQWVGGGSLISDKFILTAAHVLSFEDSLVAYAWLGVTNVNDNSQGVLYNIIGVKPHKYYAVSQSLHDIALLELDRKVQFSSVGHFIRPICLPFPGVEVDDERIIAGWGSTKNNGPMQNFTQKAEVMILDYETQCKEQFDSDLRWYPENMICAFGKDKQDSCKGDSGGPLMAKAKGIHCTYILEGIVASGNSCGETPGTYTRVEAYLDWIVQTVWPDGNIGTDCSRT